MCLLFQFLLVFFYMWIFLLCFISSGCYVFACFGCCIVFCDMSSSSVLMLPKCLCWFSKAKHLWTHWPCHLSVVCCLWTSPSSDKLCWWLEWPSHVSLSWWLCVWSSLPVLKNFFPCGHLSSAPPQFHASMALYLLAILLQLILYVG